jgi:glycosyltransferase involved in cell wall biosynthesis
VRIGVYLVGLNPTYVGGLTTYAAGLVSGLLKNNRGHEVVLFVGKEVSPLLAERINEDGRSISVCVDSPEPSLLERLTMLPGIEALHLQIRNRNMKRVCEQIQAQCDVLLCPLGFMPSYRLSVPSIVSFHDLQHEVYPQFFSWRQLRARQVRYGATFGHATMMQASSVAMKNDALRVYADRLGPERIAVIPEGVDFAAFAADLDEDARRGYGLPDEFMLYPAQLWHHKNHLRLLEALHVIRTRENINIPLVLTGAEFEAGPAIRRFIEDHGLRDQVFMLGKVPYPSLRSLYRQASFVLSASLHESNCLPLLEAAASGTPIIGADIPANRESAEIFRIRLFDPLQIGNIAETLVDAWANRHANLEAVAANREAARQLDWTAIAGMYIDQAEILTGRRFRQQ